MIKLRTRLYRIRDFELESLVYVGFEKKSYHLVSESTGENVKMGKQAFDNLCLSKIVILRELEEILKVKLNKCYKLIGMKKLNFNPMDSPDIIYRNHNKPVTPVHQYHLLSGRYMASFDSIIEAAKSISTNPKDRGEAISKCCRGLSHSALGYKWSYKQVLFLEESNKVIKRYIKKEKQ